MNVNKIFENFAADFELCIKDDNWQRIGKYFADDAIYDNVGSKEQAICGREAILEFFKEEIANFDNRFDTRTVESTSAIISDKDSLTRAWRSIYKKKGLEDLVLEGKSHYQFKDGLIQILECQLNSEYKPIFEKWFNQYGKRLMLKIRPEKLEDINSIRQVNLAAFEQPNEADLVDKLRSNCKDFISLVAEDDNHIVGHILFTPVKVETKKGIVEGMGLAPMAVLPKYQKKGIGTKLIEKGIEELKKREYSFVVVLGHPEYYPKFGFEVASMYDIRCKWEVPDEAFMIMKLKDVNLDDFEGMVKYRPEFDGGASKN